MILSIIFILLAVALLAWALWKAYELKYRRHIIELEYNHLDNYAPKKLAKAVIEQLEKGELDELINNPKIETIVYRVHRFDRAGTETVDDVPFTTKTLRERKAQILTDSSKQSSGVKTKSVSRPKNKLVDKTPAQSDDLTGDESPLIAELMAELPVDLTDDDTPEILEDTEFDLEPVDGQAVKDERREKAETLYYDWRDNLESLKNKSFLTELMGDNVYDFRTFFSYGLSAVSDATHVQLMPLNDYHGLDVTAVLTNGQSVGFMLKRYQSKVTLQAIKEAIAGGNYHEVDRVIVVATGGFTLQAIIYALRHKVTLISGKQMLKQLKKLI